MIHPITKNIYNYRCFLMSKLAYSIMKKTNEAQFMMKIAYPIQFCKSESEAVANLERLIVAKQCGMDEGVQFYISQITSILEREPEVFPDIPLGDFPFSKSQMKMLLFELKNVLSQKDGVFVKLRNGCKDHDLIGF